MPKVAINERLFDELLELFRVYALEFFDFRLSKKQESIAREVIKRLMMRKRWRIVISICRQVGKTENIVLLLSIIWKFFEFIHSEKCRMCITAPERGTGSEVYDRMKLLLVKCAIYDPHTYQFSQFNNDAVQYTGGSRVDKFGLFKGYAKKEDQKTTREGRTFHLIVRDEMHLGDDDIYKDELEPAMTTTGGIDVWIGNGGFRECNAKELCDLGKKDEMTVLDANRATVFKYTYDAMREEAEAEFERTGNEMYLRWIDAQDAYIEENGLESPFVRKNLFCEWIVEIGNFVSAEELKRHKRLKEPDSWLEAQCDAGVDFGKSDDETWVTITDYRRNVREWLVLSGSDYEKQTQEIADFFIRFEARTGCKIKRVYCDSTGVGDPVKTMLRMKTRKNVIGIVFSASSKDVLARKAMLAINSKNPDTMLTYPGNHKHTKKFERQMLKLEKEIRGDSELVDYHHPKKGNVKDDAPDSLFLSLFGMQKLKQTRTFTKNTIEQS